MKFRTALLAGIGLIGGACLLPLAPASAQTANAPAANSASPKSGTDAMKPNTGATAPMPGSTSGQYGTTGSGSTMGSSSPAMGTMGSNTNMGSDEVSKLQQALNGNGERIKVDGVMGPQTEAALRDYQQKNGLAASGQLDDQTRQKLNLGS